MQMKTSSLLVFTLAALFAAPACNVASSSTAKSDRVTAIESLEGDTASGSTLFSGNCASCHGASGQGISGPSLTNVDETVLIDAMLSGPDAMPSFSGLTDQQLADLTAFVVQI